MRKTVAALALSAAAAGSMMLAGSAHAATTARPAERSDLPGYECLFRGPAPTIWPPIINGRFCAAVNGAPEGGFVRGPVRISIREEEGRAWICRHANAENYPESVVGHECFPEEEGPF